MKAPKKTTRKKAKQLTQKEPTVTKVDLSEKKEEQPKDDNVAKVDLSKKEEEPVKEEQPKEEVVEEVKEEVTPEEKTEVKDTPVIEEVTDEEVEEKVEEAKEEVVEAIEEAKETGEPLPENIQKVVDFMNETGGSLDEYVKLNQDYSKLDNNQLLKEYYKQTKPHLDDEEISFLMEDQFSYDEESDEERDIRRKKLAIKEQVADAKSHLEGLKSKYYADIKAGVKLTSDQQKAIDFFNRYNNEQKQVQQKTDVFNKKTNEVFTDKFKGFEYTIGEKKFRFNVKDADKVKNNQQNLNSFIKPFLNKENVMDNAKGYHKALFTGRNADAIANHFYQQGKADAMKESVAKAKNVSMDPRQQFTGTVEAGGLKVRAISGDDARKLRVKIRK
tara:strand:- start:560 stop:1720 length:1161 start_codon:yes stop_codon:yes gene_type:complete